MVEQKDETRQVIEMADAHCHLDLIGDYNLISNSILNGVRTIITNGVDTKSNMKALELADGKHIFPMIGIDPEHAMKIGAGNLDKELEFNLNLARQNVGRIAGIGEIGLDYKIVTKKAGVERQTMVFGSFLDLAIELDVPVSVHARNAIGDVLGMLEDRGVQKAHLHYFEGGEAEAKRAEKLGCMISVPPLESGKRARAIKVIPTENLMVESDAPVVGDSPSAVQSSIGMIATATKGRFEDIAWATANNAKRFFNIRKLLSTRLMR